MFFYVLPIARDSEGDVEPKPERLSFVYDISMGKKLRKAHFY